MKTNLSRRDDIYFFMSRYMIQVRSVSRYIRALDLSLKEKHCFISRNIHRDFCNFKWKEFSKMVIYKGENKNRRDKENVEKNCPFLPLPLSLYLCFGQFGISRLQNCRKEKPRRKPLERYEN